MTLPTSQIQETFRDELVDDPDKRFHKFFQHYCDVNLNHSFSVEKYYRSGKEMIRMANIYFTEKDYFHAFIIYSRFLVLFLDKIKTHPQYATSDKSESANINKQLKTVVFPRAEKLKVYIKETFVNEANEHRIQLELEKKKLADKQTESTSPSNHTGNLSDDSDDYNSLKDRYNKLNEDELRELQEKELNALADSLNGLSMPSKPSAPPAVEEIKQKPTIDRSLKPKTPGQNAYNLRTITMPSDLTKKFLEVAEANTKKNIETCGILAGKLSQNRFVLSHCIIPKQRGTSDTCTTEQEHELFDVIDQSNLITLGWIHTHPSQTAFLSSIDLHTHYGYQIMIPEAIAIVCAPSFNEIGTFFLSPSFGLKEIADCSKSGFHPHSTNPPLFEECDHVTIDNNLKIDLIDLRMMTFK